MTEVNRSEQACPVCGQHQLALDEPPRIDVMGVQAYSDMLGMGDLQGPGMLGIVCLSCGTRWRDRSALERNEAEPADAAAESIEEPDEAAWAQAEADVEDGQLE